MALISRWQLSNFLNSGNQRRWRPDFVGETIDVGGGSAAVVMDNGTGKTSMADALLFTLSMNSVLRKRTAGRVAPESYGFLTHVRIEFVVPDEHGQMTLIDLGMPDTSGDYHVLGMYGTRRPDNGLDYDLYYYQGRLEDVPVHTEEAGPDGLPIKGLVPNEEFQRALRSAPGCRIFSPKSDMEKTLRNFMSLEQRDQLVAYQTRGGGDKSAAFYDVRQRPGEPYDRAFFRQVIGPIVLSNPVAVSDAGERAPMSLEQEIITQSDAVIEAKSKTEEYGKQVKRLEEVFAAISDLNRCAVEALEAHARKTAVLRESGGEIRAVHDIITSGILPGGPMPVSHRARYGRNWDLLAMSGMEPGQGLVVERDAVARHLGLAGAAFQDALELRDSQVIPFSAANITRGISGHDTHLWLRLAEVREIVEQMPAAAQGGALEKLDQLIDVAATHALHPVRQEEREARLIADDLRQAIKTEEGLLGQESERLQELTRHVEDVEANETAYREVLASTDLTEEEKTTLASEQALKERADAAEKEVHTAASDEAALDETKARLEERNKVYRRTRTEFPTEPVHQALQRLTDEKAAAETAFECRKAEEDRAGRRLARLTRRFQILDRDQKEAAERRKELGAGAQALTEVRQTHGQTADPTTVLRKLETSARQADEAVRANKELQQRLSQDIGQAGTQIALLEAEIHSLAQRLETLDELERAAGAFALRVPSEIPGGYEERLRGEQATAQARREAAQRRLDDATPLISALEAFRAAHPDQTPAAWLADVQRQREQNAVRIGTLKDERAVTQSQLQRLRETRVAPSAVNLKVEDLIGRTGHAPLHRVLDGLPLTPNRKQFLLSAFSAILHAPVFADAADAAEAATRIADADIPVPVLLNAEVERIARDDHLPLRQDAALHSLVLSGIRTTTVDLIVDPEAFERRIAAFESRIAAQTGEIEALDAAQAAIADTAEAVIQARQAQRAIDENAEQAAAKATAEISEANRRLTELDALLQPDLIALAEKAAAYRATGGKAEHDKVRQRHGDAIEECNSHRTAKAETVIHLEDAVAAAEELGQLRDAARDLASAWDKPCAQAADFLQRGGLEALAAVEQRLWHLGRRIALRERLECRTQEASDEARRATLTAADEKTKAASRLAEWRTPLKAAQQFEADGGPEFLAAYPADKERATARTEKARRLHALPFHKAAAFLAVGGDQERVRVVQERARLGASIEHRRQRILTLASELGPADDRHAAARKRLEAYDRHIRNILDAFPEVRKIYADPVLRADVERTTVEGQAADITTTAETLRRDADQDGDPQAIAQYLAALARRVDEARIPSQVARLRAAQDAYAKAFGEYGRQVKACHKALSATPIGFEATLQRIAEAEADPRLIKRLHDEQEAALNRQKGLLETAKAAEQRNRDTLQHTLFNQSSIAAQSIATLRRVLQKGEGATFLLVNDEVASDEAIASMVQDLIERVETQKRRFEEDAAKGKASGDAFSESFRSSIRDDLHDQLFPKAGILVRHPLMRGGTEFPLIREGISGGQATALNLLWAIKLAAFAVERETSHLTGSRRRKAAAAAQSIIIVDGLFSDLSEPGLIAESLDAMKEIKGNFQLIGLIHSPYYRNDWVFFPTCLNGRHVDSEDEETKETIRMVTVETVPGPGRGRVRTTALRAVNTLARS